MTLTLDRPRAEEAGAAAPAHVPHPKLVIMAWSGELDRVWPALILANTAAAAGKDVTIFFTFWGLFPLVRNDVRVTGASWMQRMLSLLNPGGTDRLRLSRLNMLGMGASMMRILAARHGVAAPAELLDAAREAGVHLVPCQMTMDLLGLRREDLVEGLEEPAGAMTALGAAENATTLFI